MTSLWKRILVERRSLIIPIAAGVALNLAAYALWVYPLGVKSAGQGARAAVAAQALKSAERDFAAAKALITGKSRADEELSTFYDKVLPATESDARRQTYSPLAALAKKTNVKFAERRTEPDPAVAKNARVGRLQIRMVLQGEYEALRKFIYDVESSQEFIIIDDITLSQNDPGKPLTLILEMSTYYRLRANCA
jgi:type II secretion system (T2SS) protein M